MKWNVYCYNINSNKIEIFNIFDHGGFDQYVQTRLKQIKNKDECSRILKEEAHYYFWSRAQWELIVEVTEDNLIFLKPWVGCKEPEQVKIDVTDDINFNWKGFVNQHIKNKKYKNCVKIDVFSQLEYVWEDFVTYCWNQHIMKK